MSFQKSDPSWVPGIVLSVSSPMNYQMEVEDVIWKRQQNQLRPRSVPLSQLAFQANSHRTPTAAEPRPTSTSHGAGENGVREPQPRPSLQQLPQHCQEQEPQG